MARQPARTTKKAKDYTPHKPSKAQLKMWEVAKANGVQGYVSKLQGGRANYVVIPLKRTPYYATNTSVGFVRSNPTRKTKQVGTKLYMINQREGKERVDPAYVWVTSLEVEEVQ